MLGSRDRFARGPRYRLKALVREGLAIEVRKALPGTGGNGGGRRQPLFVLNEWIGGELDPRTKSTPSRSPGS